MTPDVPAVRRSIVKPRDAASVVLVRRVDRRHEVLMGRRPAASRFMPGVYVFPGGSLHGADRRIQPARPLAREALANMAVGGSAVRARALANAAVRELFEETGLILAQPGDAGVVDDPSWQALRTLGLAPDHGRLRYVGRAITPTFMPARFHARFFLADGATATGRLGGDGELEDLGWLDLDRIAERPLADVTQFMLQHVCRMLEQPATVPGYPMFTMRGRRPFFRYTAPPVTRQ